MKSLIFRFILCLGEIDVFQHEDTYLDMHVANSRHWLDRGRSKLMTQSFIDTLKCRKVDI